MFVDFVVVISYNCNKRSSESWDFINGSERKEVIGMYDVFISYSFADRQIADAVCSYLEAHNLRCWYAPRNVRPGCDYRHEIMTAIGQSKCMVLIYSKASNHSVDVKNEITAAFKARLPVLPFRIDNVEMEPALAYYLNGVHWLDAMKPPMGNRIHELYQTVCTMIGMEGANAPTGTSSAPTVNLLIPAAAIAALALVLALVLPSIGKNKPDPNPTEVPTANPSVRQTEAQSDQYPQAEEQSDQYPQTEEQINLTNSVIANVGHNLSYINELAKVYQNILDTAEKYLLTGETAQKVNGFEIAANALDNLSVDQAEPTESLLTWMQNSPFNPEELSAMHGMAISLQQETIDTLEYMEFITGEECALSKTEKLRTVELYQDYLEQTLQWFAYCTNEMLLPINQEQHLETFWKEMLPYMGSVPLNQTNWSRDKQALVAAGNECYENLEDIILELSTILGNSNVTLQQEKENLLQELQEQGYFRKRAEKIVDYMSRNWDAELAPEEAERKRWELDVMLKFSVLKTDTLEITWKKITYLIALDMYEEAEEAIGYYQVLMDHSGGSDRYMPGLALYLDLKKQATLDFGIMVMEYYEPDGINEQLMIGDIIYSFNGEACRTVADYLAMKAALTEDSYVLKVLRLDEKNKMQVLELTLAVDAPRMYFNDLTPTEE